VKRAERQNGRCADRPDERGDEGDEPKRLDDVKDALSGAAVKIAVKTETGGVEIGGANGDRRVP
jgi:hypothetical protein